MSPIGRMFPQIYSTSFYSFAVKTIGVVAYAIILSIIFGYFINDGSSATHYEIDESSTHSSSALELLVEVNSDEMNGSDNLIYISSEERDEALSGRTGALSIGADKLEEVKFDGTKNRVLIEE